MRVGLGADHAGFLLKEAVRRSLDARHVPYEDFGTHSPEPVDYPVYAARVVAAVASGGCDCGILDLRDGYRHGDCRQQVRRDQGCLAQ